jgi:hypothetical protein
VAFLGLAGAVQQDDFKPANPQLSQGLASRSSVRSAVWEYLLPAQILRRWLDAKASLPREVLDQLPELPVTVLDDAAVRKALPKLLWGALGTGSELSAQGDVNVLEFLVGENDDALARKVRKVMEPVVLLEDAAVTALHAAAKSLAEPPAVKGDKAWTAADIDRWEQKIEYFKVMKEAHASRGNEFKKAWLGVSEAVLSDDAGSELYGPWLAFALSGPHSAPLGADWERLKIRLLTPGEVRSDHWIRARASGIATGQWKAAETIIRGLDAEKPDAKIDNVDLKLLVGETLTNIKSKLRDSAGSDVVYGLLVQNGLEAFVTYRAEQWHEFMKKSVQRSRRRPRDRGVRLDFSTLVGDPQNQLRQIHMIRGYAIALCAGTQTAAKGWIPDIDRAAWLTDTALHFVDQTGKWNWLNSGGSTAWMHESVGATFSDGELLLSVEYEGAPLATTLSVDDSVSYDKSQDKDRNEDEDGFKAVEFAWRLPPPKNPGLGRSLPLLGYGLLYKVAATPLDNAGGVLDPDFRSKSAVAELKAARDIGAFGNGAAPFQYRSSEPPGAPSLLKIPDAHFYELSEETQAHAWQSQMGAERPMKVALLAHLQDEEGQKLFPAAYPSCTMAVVPPTTHFAFIERWLNTDRVLIDQSLQSELSDSKLGKFSANAIAEFVERFRERREEVPAKVKPRYHPAVTAIGVETWSPRSGSQFRRIDFERLLDDQLEPNQFSFYLDVQASAAAEALKLERKDVGAEVHAHVSVPQGEFVRVRLFSLVNNNFFGKNSDTNGRFVDGIQLSVDDLPDLPKDLKGFAAFGPAEYWFETIPKWDSELNKNQVTVRLTAPSDRTGGALSPNLLTASINFDLAHWAPWVKGVYAQRHEWHWTGYPVDFPRIEADLNAWLPSLAGVESFREVVDTQLVSSFNLNNEWVIGPKADNAELFYRQELPAGRRTSRYAALFVRPMVRFRRWLNPKLFGAGPAVLESLIWGDGKIVPGRGQPGENARLPTPVLRHSIPLTSTYASVSPTKREANGVALIFDEAFRRTDDLAKVGGVGDVLELDLVETRFSKFKEIGNNPIMHGKAGPWTDDKPLALAAKSPVGLTFDIGANAKVAQTAVVVQPVNGGGHWLLAKARVRRVVLPETELGTLIAPSTPDKFDSNFAWYRLDNRVQGDEVVLPDIAIDLIPQKSLEVRLVIDDATDPSKTLAIPLPNRTDGDVRYVLSWHKGRWGDGDALPGWRCQVLVQRRHPDRLTWREIDRIGCHENSTELPLDFKSPTAWMGLSLKSGVNVRRIRLSDYTDPVWLTFIGSFGKEEPGSYADFVFDAVAGQLQRLRTGEGGNAVPPRLWGLDESLKDPKDQPLFHLVLVFRPTDDLTRGKSSPDSGMLVGVYWMRGKKLDYLPKLAEAAPDLEGCHANVIAMQRITALSADETTKLTNIKTFTELLENAFPHQENASGERVVRESLVRFLPEFLGPIQIVNKVQ